MKKLFLVLFFFSYFISSAQNVQMAYEYFRKGEYLKAASIYKKLYQKNKRNTTYFKYLISSYQEAKNYQEAEKLLLDQLKNFPKQLYLNIELGKNYHLKNQDKKADSLYQITIEKVKTNTRNVRMVARAFQDNSMLDTALQIYKDAVHKNPKANYDLYIAQIYGEKGDIENMFNSYLTLVDRNKNYYTTVQRYIGKFITDDGENTYNKTFRKLLLKRSQNNPNTAWNNLLSWMYMKQKEFHKAFIQQKAIHIRENGSLYPIFDLAVNSFENADYDTSSEAFNYVIKHTLDRGQILQAKEYLLKIAIKKATSDADLAAIDTNFQTIFSEYGSGSLTISVKKLYANFLAFQLNKPTEAIKVLKETKKVASNSYEKGLLKIQLADILVFIGKYNEALITYTQAQTEDLRSSFVAQIARLKIAQTSYYKGDFDWAKVQLKVLKSATSKLISNDALALNLLIGDNIAGDTIRTALKKYAKAELLAYQNKTKQAIDTLSLVLTNFKGHAIEDEALYKQAELYKKQKEYPFAENNYQKIIQLKKDGILVDDAIYQLGLLYQNQLNDVEKAKEMYQKILFDFPSSIYLVEARKRFRKLRGDTIEN